MALRIIRTPLARSDLLEIWTYIADDNEHAADQVLARFDQLLRMLADAPLAGRARPELGEGIRSMVSGNYVLFHRVDGDDLVLVRVRSGYLDLSPSDFD